ncbi:uncharacterized protein LOC126680237 [Mercurialis annua]|uniref:uncharacterized protein LOC126680237 n=1 Tax=Mercurialis annua TaxID=3986 RepID=UPI00215F59C4|nr:uncharacterized protein LOC126680237 [Mercurialis annua]
MLNQTRTWITFSQTISSSLPNLNSPIFNNLITSIPTIKPLKLISTITLQEQASCLQYCNARRRGGHEEEEEDCEYGVNEEIAMLEIYSESARGEALLVHAIVDDEQVEVLVFKGFSSCLSYKTSPDPSKSVLPARAIIESIDRIKGPFDPSNIEYLEKGLSWPAFKSRFAQT